ncbi:9069_t:CDS:2 [Acaulospora morrowiae]|uniref:Derlin n=1 Tax=Acaulospora morrowiae TaxID=94023 RepID=A0A9N8YQX1_9GLOM|nr:9069_t:CDS:2 [Acaulospora morrowiae]
MAIPVEEWYYEVPFITRTYVTAAVLTSLAVQVGLVNPFQLYFNFDKIFYDRQLLSPLSNMLFLGSPLAFTLVYIWSRRNPFIRLNFVGLFVFSAPFLPWVLLGFSLLLNNVFPVGDVMGIVVGHVYYFFEDVWPNERGRRWLKTPQLIVRMFEGVQVDQLENEAAANPPTNNT